MNASLRLSFHHHFRPIPSRSVFHVFSSRATKRLPSSSHHNIKGVDGSHAFERSLLMEGPLLDDGHGVSSADGSWSRSFESPSVIWTTRCCCWCSYRKRSETTQGFPDVRVKGQGRCKVQGFQFSFETCLRGVGRVSNVFHSPFDIQILASYYNRHLNPAHKRSVVSWVLFKNNLLPRTQYHYFAVLRIRLERRGGFPLVPSRPGTSKHSVAVYLEPQRGSIRIESSVLLPPANQRTNSGASRPFKAVLLSCLSSDCLHTQGSEILEAYILKLKLTYLAWCSTLKPILFRLRAQHHILEISSYRDRQLRK